MVTARVSTFTYHQRLMGDYGRTQVSLTELQRQISSGKIAQTFDKLNGRVEKVNALENKIKNLDQNMESNSQTTSYLQTMGLTTDSIVSITDDILKLIVLARSATTAQYPLFAEQLEEKMNNIAGLLNTNISGRYLFAGGKTDTRPVTEPVPPSELIGTPDDGYYQGNSERMTTRVSENFLLEYGVNANDEGFKNLIGAVNTTIFALRNSSTGGGGMMDKALDMMNSASNQINAISTRINANIVILNEANSQHSATKAYIMGVYGTETSTDTVAATTEVAMQQSILQASFQVFAKISGLKLTDYLR